jgi:hypothetical protein
MRSVSKPSHPQTRQISPGLLISLGFGNLCPLNQIVYCDAAHPGGGSRWFDLIQFFEMIEMPNQPYGSFF